MGCESSPTEDFVKYACSMRGCYGNPRAPLWMCGIEPGGTSSPDEEFGASPTTYTIDGCVFYEQKPDAGEPKSPPFIRKAEKLLDYIKGAAHTGQHIVDYYKVHTGRIIVVRLSCQV